MILEDRGPEEIPLTNWFTDLFKMLVQIQMDILIFIFEFIEKFLIFIIIGLGIILWFLFWTSETIPEDKFETNDYEKRMKRELKEIEL